MPPRDPAVVHFRALRADGTQFNLCEESLNRLPRWTPYRSAVTCPACQSRLTGPPPP